MDGHIQNKFKNKILFLGYNCSPIFIWLKKRGENVHCTNDKISVDYIINNNFDFLISYGYRYILKKKILELFPNRAINLHISYLPSNRGSDPNFYSFIDDTPKGVTIHYLDEGVDSGDIIFQKKVSFASIKNETLRTTYTKLELEIQNLFFQNWDKIKGGNEKRIPQQLDVGTLHKKNDKKHLMHLIIENGRDTKVSTLVNYKKRSKNSDYENR